MKFNKILTNSEKSYILDNLNNINYKNLEQLLEDNKMDYIIDFTDDEILNVKECENTIFNDCNEILKNYYDIIDGDKKCTDYTLNKILKASKGMFIYPPPIPEEKGKKQLCDSIEKSYEENKFPVVHKDSLTAWGNQAAEQYGLEVRDILKMKPGEKMDIIFFDRNVGDYLHGSKIGQKFNPLKKGMSYGTYTHKEGLTGKIKFDVLGYEECFEWEINFSPTLVNSLNTKEKPIFWSPIPNDISYKDLNPKTKVGWRGPSIDKKDAKYLPKYFKHYGTWWDDYQPFRTHDFLKIERIKK